MSSVPLIVSLRIRRAALRYLNTVKAGTPLINGVFFSRKLSIF